MMYRRRAHGPSAAPARVSSPGRRALTRVLAAGLGWVALGLGALGVLVPLIPTVPFLLVAACCFARSSERLDRWFRSTRLYEENLAGYVAGRGMSRAAKVRIMGVVTLLLAIAFVAMRAAPLGRVVLVAVWLAHAIYFAFGIKTARA